MTVEAWSPIQRTRRDSAPGGGEEPREAPRHAVLGAPQSLGTQRRTWDRGACPARPCDHLRRGKHRPAAKAPSGSLPQDSGHDQPARVKLRQSGRRRAGRPGALPGGQRLQTGPRRDWACKVRQDPRGPYAKGRWAPLSAQPDLDRSPVKWVNQDRAHEELCRLPEVTAVIIRRNS